MTPVRGDSEHTFPSLRGGECAPLIYHETATSSSRSLTVDASLTTANGFCMKPSTASASSTGAFSGDRRMVADSVAGAAHERQFVHLGADSLICLLQGCGQKSDPSINIR